MSKIRPVLIPTPRKVIYREGSFALGRNVTVHLQGGTALEDGPQARVLRGELARVLQGERPTTADIDPRRKSCELRVAQVGAATSKSRSTRPLPRDGYELRVTPKEIGVRARGPAGLFYAVVTLGQLASGTDRVPCVEISDWSELGLRGVHYDLKGVMPTFEALMNSLTELSRLKLNCILLEYEDKFPWSRDTGLASPLALSERELRRFLGEARARHIRVIPLIQTLGHAEMVLQHRRYAGLREARDNYYQYCPSNPGSVDLLKRLLSEVTAVHAGEPLLHMGADEAWLLGTCPRCESAVGKVGKNGLYLQHMKPVWEHVRSLGKRPLMWDDMLRHFTTDQLKQVPRDVMLMYWLYNRFEPDVATNFPHLPGYLDLGFEVLGASAAKGADGRFANVPNFDRRLRNVFAWAEVAERHKLGGVVSTAWSRYTYLLAPCEPFETMWLSLAGSAEAYWTGAPPSPGAFTKAFLRLGGGQADDELAELLLHPERTRFGELSRRLKDRAESQGPRQEYWELLSALYELEGWVRAREEVEKEVVHQLPLLEAGRLPRSSRLRLTRRARRALAMCGALRRQLRRILRKSLPPAEVTEFLTSRLDGYQSVLQGLADAVR